MCFLRTDEKEIDELEGNMLCKVYTAVFFQL